MNRLLTSDEHHADGEDFLGVGVGGDVSETDARQRREGEIERGDVSAAYAGATLGLVVVLVVLVGVVGEDLQPAHFAQVVLLRIAYGVPGGCRENLSGGLGNPKLKRTE